MIFTVEVVGCRDDYALSRVGMAGKLKEYRGLHVESSLKLKVNAVNCVTVRMGQNNFLTSFGRLAFGRRFPVKSEPVNVLSSAGQVFTIYRDGAQVLDFHALHQTGRKPIRMWLRCSFRRVPPAFKTMMWSIAGNFRGPRRFARDAAQTKNLPEASLRKLWQMGSMNVAAVLRCAYMLLEVPKAPGGRRYILEVFSSRLTRHSGEGRSRRVRTQLLPRGRRTPHDSRIISMVSALQTVGQKLQESEDPDITCALLPKKFLRMICDAAITNLPLCQSPDDVEGSHQNQREQERHERELATLDRERIWTLSLVGTYACRFVVRPILRKLQVASQRPLPADELLVFADFANLMAALVQSIFDNEMRCLTQESASFWPLYLPWQDHKKRASPDALALQDKAKSAENEPRTAGTAENSAVATTEEGGGAIQAIQLFEPKKKGARNALSEERGAAESPSRGRPLRF
eukprot:g99.t1